MAIKLPREQPPRERTQSPQKPCHRQREAEWGSEWLKRMNEDEEGSRAGLTGKGRRESTKGLAGHFKFLGSDCAGSLLNRCPCHNGTTTTSFQSILHLTVAGDQQNFTPSLSSSLATFTLGVHTP